MLQIERRFSEREARSDVWPEWKRRIFRCRKCLRVCQMMLVALVFGASGALVGWVFSHPWKWVKWEHVSVQHRLKPDGNSELVIDLDWHLEVDCDRLRLVPPWSLIAYYPERNIAVALPRRPSDELQTQAERSSGRVIISLDRQLDPAVRHEISIGLSCLQDANGGTVHDADVEVVVKEFRP